MTYFLVTSYKVGPGLHFAYNVIVSGSVDGTRYALKSPNVAPSLGLPVAIVPLLGSAGVVSLLYVPSSFRSSYLTQPSN